MYNRFASRKTTRRSPGSAVSALSSFHEEFFGDSSSTMFFSSFHARATYLYIVSTRPLRKSHGSAAALLRVTAPSNQLVLAIHESNGGIGHRFPDYHHLDQQPPHQTGSCPRMHTHIYRKSPPIVESVGQYRIYFTKDSTYGTERVSYLAAGVQICY